ncbi:MAG: CxxxxCH/CxxCH domain-containing protein [Ignavibacteriales bacterium]|nr:CxxxxCH/CxxCH domain-containing protein [Ignavibacteriales bacterium]
MEKKVKYIISFFLFGLLFLSCADIKENIPTSFSGVAVHSAGFAKAGNPDFHGTFIKSSNWDMKRCQQCHGIMYDGGLSKASCLTCHNQPAGPENCATCHEDSRDLNGNTAITERGVGAHKVHLEGNSKGKTLSCSECHNVPVSVYQAGHIDDGKAEVMFNSFFANIITNKPSTSEYDSQLPLFEPNPQYNFTTAGCTNTYCHGTFKNGNTQNAPVWTNPSSAACGTCHGDPTKTTIAEKALPKTQAEGGTHVNVLTCSACHGDVVNANLQFINSSKHIDGKLNLFGKDIDY